MVFLVMVFGTLGRECQHSVSVGTRTALPVPSLLPVGPAEVPSERRDDQLRRSRPAVALCWKCDSDLGSRHGACLMWSQVEPDGKRGVRCLLRLTAHCVHQCGNY